MGATRTVGVHRAGDLACMRQHPQSCCHMVGQSSSLLYLVETQTHFSFGSCFHLHLKCVPITNHNTLEIPSRLEQHEASGCARAYVGAILDRRMKRLDWLTAGVPLFRT